jgi:hypothetical protein
VTHSAHSHCVHIEAFGFLWLKRYRYKCTCGEIGRWYKSETVPMSQGWFHDDVTLFNLLTKRPEAS